jgi:hypothetical protein
MEERQPRIPAQPYSRDRTMDSYRSNDADYLPLDEEANVVPIHKPRLEGVAETPLNSRSSKRKSSNGRSSAAKQKSVQSFRQYQQNAAHQPFADELRLLEAQAERINQILSDRAHKKAAYTAQSPQQQPASQPQQWQARSPQPQQWQVQSSQPVPPQQKPVSQAAQSLDQADTESLKLQARQIRQRLLELEGAMEEPWQPSEELPQSSYPNKSVSPDAERMPLQHEQYYPNKPVHPPAHPYPEKIPFPLEEPYSAHNGAQQPLSHRSAYDLGGQPFSAPPARRSEWRYLELPRKPLDRVGDAILWIAASAALRVGLRYVLASVPMLSPVLSLLMLAPAALALYLAFCVPKAGWVPIYRLFLITVGLLVGGKF